MAASDQIRQMVNFILQEAHEKANEIRVKVCATDLFSSGTISSDDDDDYERSNDDVEVNWA